MKERIKESIFEAFEAFDEIMNHSILVFYHSYDP